MNENLMQRDDTRCKIIFSYVHETEWKWHYDTRNDAILFSVISYCRVRTLHFT